MLAQYVESETRTINFYAMELGMAQGLADDGILYKPDIQFTINSVPYSIHEWALAYLTKNSALVNPAVSTETRWNSKK